MRNRFAFTLVELLVVMAIIGVLVAMLLPALGSVRASSRSATCKNNLHQLGLGLHMHLEANHGRFPLTNHAGAGLSWVQTLKPFTSDVDAIRICPDDPQRELWLSGTRQGTSYVINQYVASLTVVGGRNNIALINSPAKLIVLFEGADGRAEANEHAHCSKYYSPLNIANSTSTVYSALTAEINPARHGNSANYLFADRHVETISEATFKKWVEQDIADGTNFMRPAQ